jgi:RNA polymerase-binding transcription factor DksA
MFSSDYIESMRLWLLVRRKSKSEILKQGGELASLHSPKDIRRIDFALKRIENGQYGLCTNCGLPIEMERLKFLPETPFCSKCIRETKQIAH